MTIENIIALTLALSILGFMASYTHTRNEIGKPVESKWASRKFAAFVVASVTTLLKLIGIDISDLSVILIDTVCGIYVALQGYLDVKKVKNG